MSVVGYFFQLSYCHTELSEIGVAFSRYKMYIVIGILCRVSTIHRYIDYNPSLGIYTFGTLVVHITYRPSYGAN